MRQLEAKYGLTIVGKDSMPHDLWPAIDLPPLDAVDNLTLVLAGFHVTFQFSPDGSSIRLVAMPKEASLGRTYTAGADARQLAEKLAAQFPAATIRSAGRDLEVDGPYEVHDAVARLLRGQRVRTPSALTYNSQKTYSLTVENQLVGGVMKALSRQLGKEIVFDVKVERRLNK